MAGVVTVKVAVESNLDKAKGDIERALSQWATRCGGEMVNLANRDKKQGGTPVDTGRLRNSIGYAKSQDNKTVYVGSNVNYALFVEEGVRGESGAHMFRNAVMDVKGYAEELLKFALDANK